MPCGCGGGAGVEGVASGEVDEDCAREIISRRKRLKN
jgi:uncharacterized protein GlcG (DUF336 family)